MAVQSYFFTLSLSFALQAAGDLRATKNPHEIASFSDPAGRGGPVHAITFLEDASRIAASRDNATIQVWRLGSSMPELSFQANRETRTVHTLAYLPSCGLVAAGNFGVSPRTTLLVVCDSRTGKPNQTLELQGDLLAFSRDGKSAIVRDTVPQAVDVKKTEAAKASSHATVYEVPSGKKVFQLTEESWIDQAQFTADGNSIVTVVALNRIGVWNVKGQRRAFQRKSIDNVRAFALSGDGKRMYASKVMDVPNRSFVEWELEENRVARRFDVPYATLLLVSPDGKTLAVSRGSNITVFETRQGKLLSRWDTGLQDVTCMRFSGSGPYLAAGGSGGMIKIWKVDQGPQ